jgi:protein tyrosine/serine phosphatase
MPSSVRRFIVFALLSLPVYAQPIAQPVVPKVAGIKPVGNFHQVNDHIYRGAQPSHPEFAGLANLGIKTVIDLRESGTRADSERKAVEGAGMRYMNIPLNGYHAPSEEVVRKLLTLLDDSSVGPVFVHCRRGADRTGTILACYRIAHDHWENGKALAEAKSFGMSWTEGSMQNFIVNYKARELTIGPATPAQRQ